LKSGAAVFILLLFCSEEQLVYSLFSCFPASTSRTASYIGIKNYRRQENAMFESHMNSQCQLRTMTLTGQGQVTIIPDMAVIRLGVEQTGTNLAAVQSQNAQISQAVLETLRRMGIREVKTFQYTIDKYYEYEN